MLACVGPIVFDTSLAEQAAPEGQTYTMRCRAQGQSQPRIIWKVDQRNPQRKIIIFFIRIRHLSTYMCISIPIVWFPSAVKVFIAKGFYDVFPGAFLL